MADRDLLIHCTGKDGSSWHHPGPSDYEQAGDKCYVEAYSIPYSILADQLREARTYLSEHFPILGLNHDTKASDLKLADHHAYNPSADDVYNK